MKKNFVKNVKKISKKFNISKELQTILIVGKDCKRENIWRTKLFPEYKANRPNNNSIKYFFKIAYDEELFQKGGVKAIIQHNHLEADDCIAISTKFIQRTYPDISIFIITSDKDYLQLSSSNVHLYNLNYKKLTDQKSCHGDPKLDLFCKIVTGDVSDNICSVLKNAVIL